MTIADGERDCTATTSSPGLYPRARRSRTCSGTASITRRHPLADPEGSMARRGLRRPSRVALTGAAGFLLTGGALALGALATTQHAGPQGDGTAYTSYGWRVTPAGSQTTLADKPYNAVLSPDGAHLLVTNNGVGDQALQVIDTATGQVQQSIHYTAPDALFVGVVYSPDGTHAYASAGDNQLVRTYTVAADGSLTEGDPIPLATDDGNGNTLRPFPA